MNRVRVLLLSLPVLVGALSLHHLASIRPQVLFVGQEPISCLVFSGDGKTLLVSQGLKLDYAKQLSALDVSNHFVTRWTYRDGFNLSDPKFFDSSKRILVGAGGGTVRSLDAHTGNVLWRQTALRKAEISPDGNWVAHNGHFAPRSGRTVTLPPMSEADIFVESFSRPGQQTEVAIGEEFIGPNDSGAKDFAFSPDGNSFVVDVTREDGTHLDIYDVKTWRRTHTWPEITKGIGIGMSSVQWSRDGRFLLSVTEMPQSPEVVLSLWRVRDGKKLSSLTLACKTESLGFGRNRTLVPSFALQNDGRVLTWGADGPVSLSKTANLASGFQELQSPTLGPITAAALSPDGSYLLVGTQSGRVYRHGI